MRLERDGECITVSPRVLKSVVGRKEISLMLNLKPEESRINDFRRSTVRVDDLFSQRFYCMLLIITVM